MFEVHNPFLCLLIALAAFEKPYTIVDRPANFFALILSFALVFAAVGTFLNYNGYSHQPGEVNYQLHFDPILNEAEYPVAHKVRIDLLGKIISQKSGNAAQAEISQKIQLLRQAYVSGGDLIFTLNDGSPGPTSIYNNKTLGGLRVIKPPEFPDGGAAQYVTQLDYTIALEAEVPTVTGAGALWSFQESLEFEGDGGSATDVLTPQKGRPVPQTLKQFTPIRAVQRGEAVGYLAYWNQVAMPPRWPRPILQGQLTRSGARSPQAIGRGKDRAYKLFPTFWEYHFVSPLPIAGLPSVWPVNA